MGFILGIVLGALLIGLFVYLKSIGFSLSWYEWLIGIVGLLLLFMTIQNMLGSMIELESQAAWMFALIMGLPAVLLLAVDWRLIARRKKAV
jgi:uncharacterized membrane protein